MFCYNFSEVIYMKNFLRFLLPVMICTLIIAAVANAYDDNMFGAVFTCENKNGMIKDAKVTVSVKDTVNIRDGFFTLEWSDGERPIEGFTPIKVLDYSSDGTVEIELNNALAIPDGAKGIQVTWSSKKNDKTYTCYCEIPAENYIKDAKLITKFSVLSDIHIRSASDSDLHTKHFANALEDICSLAPDTSMIFSVGDNVDAGVESMWKKFAEMRDSFLEGKNIQWHCAIGNHEVSFGNASFYKYMKLFLDYSHLSNVYYSVDAYGSKFIVLGTEKGAESLYANLSDDQLNWLKDELSKAEKGKPIFVFLHQPLKDTTSGTLSYVNATIQDWYGVNPNDELQSILNSYPNVMLFCGHGHWTYDSLVPCLAGYGDAASYFNTASVAYLWNDEDREVVGSQGLFVEMYDKYTLIKAYDFANDKWMGAAQFMILSDQQAEDLAEARKKAAEEADKTPVSDAHTDDNDDKKGCGSVISFAAAAAVTAFAPAMIKRRRKDQ